jgi:hypothetical protein
VAKGFEMKQIEKLSKYMRENFESTVDETLVDILTDDKEISKLDSKLIDNDGYYYGWTDDDIELLSADDKKELEHLLLMFLNRAKKKVIEHIRKKSLAR